MSTLKPETKKVMNLSHFLTQTSARFPHQAAVIQNGNSVSWYELEQKTNAFAAGLKAKGVGKGCKVLVHTKNNIEIIITQLAIFRLGAVWVPTNFRITPEEALYLFESSMSEVLIIQSNFSEHYQAIATSEKLKWTITIGQTDWGNGSMDELMTYYKNESLVTCSVDYDDPCWYFFTSGTTGHPKAAVLTHGQMSFVITNHLCDLMPQTYSHTDASIVVAPLSHGAGIHYLTQLARGVTTILPVSDHFDPENIWKLIEEHKVTNLFTVPTIVNTLVQHESIDRYDHSSLRYMIYAGAPMYCSDQKYALNKLGSVLVQYYGLGEVTGNITILPNHLHLDHSIIENNISSCGYARTGIQISIQDSNGNELPSGEAGEICVCGLAVFSGYYNNPKANMESFRNGWFRTGDIGYMNISGLLFITGRLSDMYISGGSNIYPREIEEKILLHPNVKEIAIFGVPDPKWGESGIANIVEAQPSLTSQENIRLWIKDNIASYKAPKHILFLKELPKSGYGKINKNLLKDQYHKQ